MTKPNSLPLAPGARVEIRDAEWICKRVDRASGGGFALTVTGVSEIVRDREAVFLTEIEDEVRVLDPAETKLVRDDSGFYRNTRLYLEALLRQTPPTGDGIYVGHRGAMDAVEYQLEPAAMALAQPRQRMLIADAVGLGKTLEAGILLSELIRRGRGRRILVITMKSMLAQFQKEMWSRFTIPLVRLDSQGIQRVRARVPANHNPFYYYDKSIISIDTLKQDHEYRTWLEQSRWDVIVIDEAHSVAHRGTRNLRHRLAKLLAERSDALIMLTATPHDGKPRSFASIMNMLDPTAIADQDNYTREDIRGLFIRRHKKDVHDQVRESFRERSIATAHVPASAPEEAAFDVLTEMNFTRLDQRRGAGQLFRTTLEKALFSSPAACLETLDNRIRTLEKKEDAEEFEADIIALQELRGRVEEISLEEFTKYRKLVELLTGEGAWKWDGSDATDRLVIFTERIKTLDFLREHLPAALGLKDDAVGVLHGGMPDVDQMEVVENFGKDNALIRLLLASDVASEGINLHYLSHRMIHFDIPWSLIRFQQRNGRIDRYGQQKDPQILYLQTDSRNERIHGDQRILDLLIEKDQHVHENIGDPVEFTGIADVDEDERRTAAAIEEGKSRDQFSEEIEQKDKSFFDLLMEDAGVEKAPSPYTRVRSMLSLFGSDYQYCREAVEFLKSNKSLQTEFDDNSRTATITAPEELRRRFRNYPREVLPDDHRLILTPDAARVQDEVRRCRQDEEAWPKLQYLWPLHPVFDWLGDGILSQFGRHEAPVMTVEEGLAPGEVVVVMSCLIPNRKGQPLLQHWCGVCFEAGKHTRVEEFAVLMQRTKLGSGEHPNAGEEVDTTALEKLLPEAVDRARVWMGLQFEEFEVGIKGELETQLTRLRHLRQRQRDQVEQRFRSDDTRVASLQQQRREKQLRDIERIFSEYQEWIEDSMTGENRPYIKVAAVLKQ
ncbi:DEAD/DEAH box helicase [bacterium]|nr:DEAD/DEAH box helicase [bacterium]